MNNVELLSWMDPVMHTVSLLLILASGTASILASARGSARYRYFISSLGLAVIIAAIFYLIRMDMTTREIEWLRANTNAIDGVLESEMTVHGYANGMRYLFIACSGLIMGFVSLMMRGSDKSA